MSGLEFVSHESGSTIHVEVLHRRSCGRYEPRLFLPTQNSTRFIDLPRYILFTAFALKHVVVTFVERLVWIGEIHGIENSTGGNHRQ